MKKNKLFFPLVGVLLLTLVTLHPQLNRSSFVIGTDYLATDDKPPREGDDDGFFVLRYKLFFKASDQTVSAAELEKRYRHHARLLALYQE